MALFSYPDPEFDIRDEKEKLKEQTDEYAISRVGGPKERDPMRFQACLCYYAFLKKTVATGSAGFSHSYDLLWYMTNVIYAIFSLDKIQFVLK